MVRYIVKGEHTLGYVINAAFCAPNYCSIGILAGSVLRGGHDPKSGWTVAAETEIRDATLADFETYRVSPRGHLS